MVGHGDVVGMAVEAIGAEGEDDLGAETADFRHEGLDDTLGRYVDEGAGVIVGLITLHTGIAMIEKDWVLDTQGATRGLQLLLTHLGQCLTGSRAGLANLALLSEGGAYQADIHSSGGVTGKGATDGKGLVVGVGETDEHSIAGHGVFLMICLTQGWLIACWVGSAKSFRLSYHLWWRGRTLPRPFDCMMAVTTASNRLSAEVVVTAIISLRAKGDKRLKAKAEMPGRERGKRKAPLGCVRGILWAPCSRNGAGCQTSQCGRGEGK